MLQVTDIGNVAHITHLVSEESEVTEKEVECNGGTCVPEMGIAIDRRSANIHTYMPFVEGAEILFLT